MYVWKQPAGMHQQMVAFSAAWFRTSWKTKDFRFALLKTWFTPLIYLPFLGLFKLVRLADLIFS